MMGKPPGDCPSAPMQGREFEVPQRLIPCSMEWVDTGAQFIRRIRHCSRCGWIDPEALDRQFELAAKRTLSASESRTALAATGEPFTFVRSSEADITLPEALGQALGAASMCWEHPELAGAFDSERAKRIMGELMKLLREKSREDREALVQELLRNTH